MSFARIALGPIVYASLSILLSGCSGGNTATQSTPPTQSNPIPPTYPSISGNWSLAATSQVVPGTFLLGGYLSNASSSASGTIHVLNSTCYLAISDISITGTVSTAGAVSLTSSAVSGQTLTAKGKISGGELSDGTYAIAGGCAGGDHGTVTGYLVPAFTNTYAGSFLSVSGLSIDATATIAQSGPDTDGFYHVTGTASFSGSPCFSSGTIATSVIAGGYMAVTITTNTGATVTYAGYITDPTGKTISGVYEVSGGACSGDRGTGSISHS